MITQETRRAAAILSPEPLTHDFLVVSHRLPTIVDPGGGYRPFRGALGVLRPVVSSRRGGWLGWPGVADVDLPPLTVDDVRLHPLCLSRREVADYLVGSCESAISATYHNAVVPPRFNRSWRQAYVSVNERFARAAARLAAPGAVVWVHDYHLQLVPAMLRRMRPDLLIGFFMQAPFPPAELFLRMPLRTDIMAGLLGADVVAFQQPRAVHNFVALAAYLCGGSATPDGVEVDGRTVAVAALPQSIDVDAIDEVAAKAAVRRRAAELRTRLGGPRRVVLSVDRLHPAKGIENRLTAYRDLLAGGAIDAATTVLVQVAGPADADTAQTRMLRDRVERKVGQINGTFGRVGHPVVHYLHRVVEPAELVALYLAADVMVATPLVDGMSLVAKEFVAARRDDTGALVLSEFTATAHELPQAFVVNPYDVDALAVGLATALGAAAGDLAARMAAMGPQVRANSVHVWAGRLLAALGQVAVASIPLPDTALGDAIAAR